MAEWFNNTRKGYQDAMSVPQTDGITRLLLAMSGGTPKPKPAAPNYSAIPLTPSPFDVPYTGLTNTPAPAPMPQNKGPLPPFQQPGQKAADDMPSHLPNSSRQGNYGDAPMQTMPPVTVSAPAPNPADAAYVPDPRTMGDADLGGYGGSPRIPGIAPPQPYSHLNPTPSLEEIFRREYAANPMAFGGKFG